ncbi:VgrG protein [Minicystis rosea]|nr:VgrG protein [Minicystis rosea]
MTTGIGMLEHLLPQPSSGGRIYGVVVGKVTAVEDKDPAGLNRVQLTFSWLRDGASGAAVAGPWARVVAPLSGHGRGLWLLPQVGDEVAVMFEHGDPNHPYVIGGLWNIPVDAAQGAPPPETAVLKTKSGHTITLDDKSGAEKLTIESAGGKIVIDSAKNTVEITGAQGLTITAEKGNVALSAPSGDVTIDCNGFTVKAKSDVSIEAMKTGAIKATAALAVDGKAGVQINGDHLVVM